MHPKLLRVAFPGWPQPPFNPSFQHSSLPLPQLHPTLSRAISRACGWPAPFPCLSAVILLFLAPLSHDALQPVTGAKTRLRAVAHPPSQPRPECLPCSPVLLQRWSPKPESNQEALLTCVWEARLLQSQGHGGGRRLCPPCPPGSVRSTSYSL